MCGCLHLKLPSTAFNWAVNQASLWMWCGRGGISWRSGWEEEGRRKDGEKDEDDGLINLRKVYPRAGCVNNICLLCLNYCWIKVRQMYKPFGFLT